jgi:hypothetical protein
MMDKSNNTAAPVKFRCVYCGSNEVWNKPGTPVCSHCGASQPIKKTAAPAPVAGSSRKAWVAAALVLLLAAGGWFAYGSYHRHQLANAPVPQTAAEAAAPKDVTGSRIVRVDNPHVRTVAKDVEYTFDDLMTIPENAPPAPDFDTKLLTIKTPRRMTSEQLDTVYLGELTNTSPDQVAIAPVVTLSLIRGGRKIDSADHSFPDLAPGAHVPVFFHFEGDPTAFDTMNFNWKPAKAYAAAAPNHPQLVTVVKTQKLESSDSLHPGRGHDRFSYMFMRVHAAVTNRGNKEAQNVQVFVLLRDANGLLTGYHRSNLGQRVAPGATVEFDSAAAIWGAPAASVEAVALPTSPPSL